MKPALDAVFSGPEIAKLAVCTFVRYDRAQPEIEAWDAWSLDEKMRAIHGRIVDIPTVVPASRKPVVGERRDLLASLRDIRRQLAILRDEEGCPYQGIDLEFVNPQDGTPVFPTLGYKAQLLRAGEALFLAYPDHGWLVVFCEERLVYSEALTSAELHALGRSWKHEEKFRTRFEAPAAQ